MITVWIDEITPCLKNEDTGDIVETEVVRIKRKSVLKKVLRVSGRSIPMNGRMNNYKKSLQETPYVEVSPELRKIRIDYRGLLAYSREKGISVEALSDSEKDRFILNSSMQEIRKLQKA